MNYADDTGSVNTLSVAYDPPLTSYSIGLVLRVKVYVANTGAASIDAGAGRVSIKKPNGAAVAAGDLPAAGLIELVYDGTNFQMINFGGAGSTGPGDVFQVNIPYTVDAAAVPGGTNTIIANFSPPVGSLVAGEMVMVKMVNTNTGFATLNVQSLGAKPVYAHGNSPNYPMLPGDAQAGDVVLFTYDGTGWWMTPNASISQDAAFNVANNAQINDLFVALGRKRIMANATVTVTLLSGVYSSFYTYHADASRIQIIGTMLAAVPSFADFAKTGNSAAARAADSANNLAMLRSRYGTEIRYPIDFLGNCVSHVGPGQPLFANLLITGANVSGAASGRQNASAAFSTSYAAYLLNVCVWGCQAQGIGVSSGGQLGLTNCFACGCFEDGFHAHAGATMIPQGCGSFGNGGNGFIASLRSMIHCFWQTGNPSVGLVAVPGCQSMFNASNGFFSTTLSSITFGGTGNATGNATADIYSDTLSNVTAYTSSGATFGTASPAVGVQGNSLSINTTG
jgi:hypothetical protein